MLDKTMQCRKVPPISEGSRGLGRAIALRLARDGADVAVNNLTHREEAENKQNEAGSEKRPMCH
ncbi:MAG TPA: hypothetical protein VKA53_08170 [Thermoanaerobaculia bacterium]|nr:hypothetical protein [Thermoanaerobaculia bacterium]